MSLQIVGDRGEREQPTPPHLQRRWVYKIKLRTAGYRLAYEVIDNEVVVYVLAIGKRDKDAVYKTLRKRRL